MRRSANSQSFYDLFLNKNKEKLTPVVDPTFSDEREAATAKAVEHENYRKAQAEKYPKVTVSNENHPGFMEEATDEPKLVEKASRFLKEEIGELVGRGGFIVDFEELRSIKAHKDTIDDSKITDNAMMAFAVRFELPGLSKFKTVKFAVSYDGSRDEKFVLENRFLDVNDKDYTLTSASLKDFLTKMENSEVKTAKSEKPLAWFNPNIGEMGVYESISTVESSEKVASRLKTAGYDIDPLFYIDACYDPKEFGRNCFLVKVPMNKEAEFKKIAAMSDDEWINRGIESERVAPYKVPKTEWVDRGIEPAGTSKSDEFTGYDKKDYKKNQDWMDRTEDKGSKGNPYNTAEKMMRDESRKVDAEKKVEASTLSKVEELEKLLK